MIYRLIDRTDTVNRTVYLGVFFDGTNHAEVLAFLRTQGIPNAVQVMNPAAPSQFIAVNASAPTDGDSLLYLSVGDWYGPLGKMTEDAVRDGYYSADDELSV